MSRVGQRVPLWLQFQGPSQPDLVLLFVESSFYYFLDHRVVVDAGHSLDFEATIVCWFRYTFIKYYHAAH